MSQHPGELSEVHAALGSIDQLTVHAVVTGKIELEIALACVQISDLT